MNSTTDDYADGDDESPMVTPAPASRSAAARGAVITGVAQAYRVGLNFVSSVALARLLTPMDFGLVAMVSSFVAFVALIQDLGLNQATVQRSRISTRQINALFWLSTGVSLFFAAFLASCAQAIAWFYGDSRLVPLTVGFSAVVLLGGSQSQLLALMTRQLNFGRLAVVDVLGTTTSSLASVGWAWMTGSYWALFVGSLVPVFVSFVCLLLLSDFRLSWPSFEGEFKEIIKFGSGISGFNIVNYFSRNSDYLLIGRTYGSVDLGLYDRAYRLMLFPLAQIQAPLGRVMLPILAQIRSNPVRYKKAYIEVVSLLMMACQPGLIFVSIFADDVFTLLFGDRWNAAAPIFRWLGFSGVVQVMTSTVGWLFISQGRGGEFFRIGVFNAIIIVSSFVIGLPRGALGVAIAYTIANYLILLPAGIVSAGRRGPVTSLDLMKAAAPHGVGCGVCAAVLGTISLYEPPANLLIYSLLVALSYCLYGLVMLMFLDKRCLVMRNAKVLSQSGVKIVRKSPV